VASGVCGYVCIVKPAVAFWLELKDTLIGFTE